MARCHLTARLDLQSAKAEFQRLRLVYSHQMDNIPGARGANIVALQWTGVLGHHVHGFRDR